MAKTELKIWITHIERRKKKKVVKKLQKKFGSIAK